MPNAINKMIVRELTDALTDKEGMVFVSLSGLSMVETETLRDALAAEGVPMRMLRNRLATIVLKEQGFEAPDDLFKGNIGCCWGDAEAAIHAAKVFQTSPERKAGKVALKGGVLDGSLLDAKEAVALASILGRDELHAKVLGTISAPAQNLVGVLNAPMGALVRVIQARVDAGEEASA